MRVWVRPAVVGGTSLVLGLMAQSAMDAREQALTRRIGPLAEVATVSRSVPTGGALGDGNVRFVQIPRRWVPRGAIESRDGLAGRVAAISLSEGVVLAPGTTRGGVGGPSSPLGPNERIATVEAVAPVGSLHAGTKVDVLSLRGGAKPRFLGRNIELLSARVVADGVGQAGGQKVQADLRATVAQALAIAAATSSGEEVRLLPLGEGEG